MEVYMIFGEKHLTNNFLIREGEIDCSYVCWTELGFLLVSLFLFVLFCIHLIVAEFLFKNEKWFYWVVSESILRSERMTGQNPNCWSSCNAQRRRLRVRWKMADVTEMEIWLWKLRVSFSCETCNRDSVLSSGDEGGKSSGV